LGSKIKEYLNSVSIYDLFQKAIKKGVTGDNCNEQEDLLRL